LKQILKNVVINIPNDMWFERKATILAFKSKNKTSYSRYVGSEVLHSQLGMEAFNFWYNISFIDPPHRGFGEILPSVMIFPLGHPPPEPGCIPCKLYAGDTPTLTIDSIVICQTPRRRSPNFCARNAPWPPREISSLRVIFRRILLSTGT
jgi:hypothetical protein